MGHTKRTPQPIGSGRYPGIWWANPTGSVVQHITAADLDLKVLVTPGVGDHELHALGPPEGRGRHDRTRGTFP